MNINTIAIDLDGSLLDECGEVTEITTAALRRASKAGMEILLCTGRHHQDAEFVAGSQGLDTAVVSNNGALTRRVDGRLLDMQTIDPATFHRVHDAMRSLGLEIIIYTIDGIYMTPENPVAVWYRRRNETMNRQINLRITPELPASVLCGEEKLLKLAVYSEDSRPLEQLRRRLQASGIETTRSSGHNLEIMAPNVSKKSALATYLQRRNRVFDNLMAIGDGENDLEMVRAAAVGVAMGNACPALKSAADIETRSNREHGVAWIIDRLLSDELEIPVKT